MIELKMPMNSTKPLIESSSQYLDNTSISESENKSKNNDPESSIINRAYEELLRDKKYGFLKVLEDDFDWDALERFKATFNNYKQVAIVGIGGSSQGIKSLLKYVSPEAMNSDFIFFDRIDESYINSQLNKINDLSGVLWFIISKSGSSTETLFILNTLLDKTSGIPLNHKKNVVVLTDNNLSILKSWASREQLKTFSYPSDIEGRFSLFSLMSLYPLVSKIGEVQSIKSAAQWVKSHPEIVLELSEFYMQSFAQNKWVSMFWLYSERLKEFGFWLEQLWAESLGKFSDDKRRVSTPFCCYGTNDQHSLLQQMEEGFQDKSHLFLQIKKPNLDTKYNKNWINEDVGYLNAYDLDHVMKLYCQATFESLQNQPRILLTLEDSSSKVGYALHLVMALVVGTLGKALKIDIYGQPGVEKSKKIFRELL